MIHLRCSASQPGFSGIWQVPRRARNPPLYDFGVVMFDTHGSYIGVSRVTQILTQIGSGTDGAERLRPSGFPEKQHKNGAKTLESQRMDRFLAAHNPEVAGSSPVSATINRLISREIRRFLFVLSRKSCSKKSGSNFDPDSDPYGKILR